MDSLSSVIECFDVIKKKGWIKVGNNDECDYFFPLCEDISIKCTTDNKRYPIWLFSIKHDLPIEYLNGNYFFSIEKDNFNKIVRLLIYQGNVLILKKELMDLESFNRKINDSFKRLALIYTESKVQKSACYFRYTKMNIYRFRGIETFTKLLNQHIINIKINKNSISFVISKHNLEKLYKMEYHFDDSLKDFLSFLDK